MIPISLGLKKEEQLAIAQLQDQFMQSVYDMNVRILLHGGTAVWRCYHGNRFSEDIDAYLRSDEEFDAIRHNLTFTLSKMGLIINRINVMDKVIIVYVSAQSNHNIQLKVELIYKKAPKGTPRSFEKIDGSSMEVLTLTPEDMILEKIDSYNSRKFIRDIYDIYYLMNYVSDKDKISADLKEFIENIENPADEAVLSSIVYAGVAPSFESMVNAIKKEFL